MGLLVVLAVQVALFFVPSFRYNVVGALLGCLVSFVVLAFGRANYLSRFSNADGGFIDWYRMPADTALAWLSASSWGVGMFHVYFVAWELSR